MNLESPLIETLESCYKQHHKVRTVEDLYKIPLNPSSVLVHPVVDPYVSQDLDWNALLERAYHKYVTFPGARRWWREGWNRELFRWQDKLRWKLHMKLLDWGVII